MKNIPEAVKKKIEAEAEKRYQISPLSNQIHRENMTMDRKIFSEGATFSYGLAEGDWREMTDPPRLGGEYLVVWELDDGHPPVVASMDYDAKKKMWTDPRGVKDEPINSELLMWCELPSPPKSKTS